MKLELIPIMQYMDGSQSMTMRARSICEELLDSYVAHDMVVTILSTLTRLCCRVLSGVSQQVGSVSTFYMNVYLPSAAYLPPLI